MTPEVGSTANSYEILSKLAEGGMAEIFLARSVNTTGLRRHVVLKRIARERALDMEYVRMFLDEARLAAQLQHPNIAQVFDIGRLGTSYFFTMEYVHGVTVQELLIRAEERGVALPIAAVLSIIAGAAAGLGHAHQKTGLDGKPLGIVHRDVSPSNLMVSFDGHIKVVDFGVAKVIGRPETQAGTIKGKVAYLSPEQCRQMKIDSRSDLFSLGIVMWEMLTNERLFRRETPFETMAAIATTPAPLPSRLRADVPPSVDVIVRKLLAIEVGERLQTAGQVIEAVESAAMKTKSVVTPATLARLLRELFGVQPEPWLAIEREAMTVMSGPVPSDLGADDDPELARVEQKLSQTFATPMITPTTTAALEDSPTSSHDDPFDLTDEPETVLRERLPTPVSMRATRVVPSMADISPHGDFADAEDLMTTRAHTPEKKPLINTLPLEASVRPRGPTSPPPAPTLAHDVPAPTLIGEIQPSHAIHGSNAHLTIRGSGPFVPPVPASPPKGYPILPPLPVRPAPPPPPLPLRWWILGGSLLGIALTALVVVATRSSQVPVAAIDAAPQVVAVDAAPPPPDAAPVIEVDAAEAEVPIDAAEPDEMGELEAMDIEPMPVPQVAPRKQKMVTKPELNLAFRQKRYKDIVAACKDMGADGDKAIVCTLAACRAGNPIAQDWYRNVAPKERTRTVKFCAGAIQDLCATDLTACRQ